MLRRRFLTAAAGLLTWVEAIVKYHSVAKNVEPLKLKVAKMEKEQAKSEQELAKINAELAEISTAIAALTKEFEAANGELTALKTQADAMERRLTAASRLIGGLSSESQRTFGTWEQWPPKTPAGALSITQG